MSLSDVADEEQFVFENTDGQYETEKQTPEQKKQTRKKAIEWVMDDGLYSTKPSIKAFTKLDRNTTSYSLNGIKANARIRVEQNVDRVLRKLKSKYWANLG